MRVQERLEVWLHKFLNLDLSEVKLSFKLKVLYRQEWLTGTEIVGGLVDPKTGQDIV